MMENTLVSDLAVIGDWRDFHARWNDERRALQPCRLAGEIAPALTLPLDPLELLDQARCHPEARILSQSPGRQLIIDADASARVRAAPISEVAADPHLHISLFNLDQLFVPGGALHQHGQAVVAPFSAAWREHGFAYEKAWPVLFITGSASATNYHFDPMPTLPWHLFGSKRFHGLKDPRRWCPRAVIDEITANGGWPVRPEGIGAVDCLVHDNSLGDLLFIPQQVPHWVDAGTFSATLTFAFTGLRLS